MIAVWQKQTFERKEDVPPLKATLTYQKSEDEQRVYCEMTFETPYPVYKHHGVTVNRYGDRVICRYTVQDGSFTTLRIDHPDTPIYGCTTRYNRKENSIPYFFEPTFNMDITVRQGHVYMTPEREER